MTKELDVSGLKKVSETLLIMVYLRHLETRRKDGIIRDDKSVEIIERLNYDFSKYSQLYPSELNQALIAIRTEIIDRFVSKFIAEHPQATIVNLGTGLCTRFFRVDNGKIDWYGVDLPVVGEIWSKSIGESPRNKFLIGSVFDGGWMERIKASKPQEILFIAEGILMYFSELEVKYLIYALLNNFSNSHLIFDSLGKLFLNHSPINSNPDKIDITYQWGIDRLQEIETWDKRIKFVEEWSCLGRYRHRLQWMGLLGFLPLLKRQVKVGHVRLN